MPELAATLLAFACPESVNAGQSFSVTLSYRNDGTETWSSFGAAPHRVGSSNPENNTFWTPGSWRWNFSSPVTPGSVATVTVPCVAPTSLTGFRVMAFSLVKDTVAWFGPVAQRTVLVNPVQATVPPARPDAGDPAQMVVFNTGPYVTQSGDQPGLLLEWTNSTNRTLRIVKSRVWTGADDNFHGDTHCETWREDAAGNRTEIAWSSWDRYAQPNCMSNTQYNDWNHPLHVRPGEKIKLLCRAVHFPGTPVMHAHHIFSVWFLG